MCSSVFEELLRCVVFDTGFFEPPSDTADRDGAVLEPSGGQVQQVSCVHVRRCAENLAQRGQLFWRYADSPVLVLVGPLN